MISIAAGRIHAGGRVIIGRISAWRMVGSCAARRRRNGAIARLARSGVAVLIRVGGIAAVRTLIVSGAGSIRAGMGSALPVHVRCVATCGVGVGGSYPFHVRRASTVVVM